MMAQAQSTSTLPKTTPKPNQPPSRFRRYFLAWAQRRVAKTTQTTLNMHNIYIFLSREGVLYAVVIAITFVAGINYANNLVLGLCFLMASLLVITIHYTFAHLANLQVKLIDVQPAQVGDYVEVRIALASAARRPHRQIRVSFGDDDSDLTAPLRPAASTTPNDASQTPPAAQTLPQVQAAQVVSLWLPADKRGRLKLPRLTLSTVYPLGILRAWSYVFLDAEGWVYPRALAYDTAAQAFTVDADAEHANQTQTGLSDFDQLDNYQLGEPLSRISWAHVARGQGLLAKRFAEPVGQQQVLDYYQMPAPTHEERLAQLRYGLDTLQQAQVAYRLRLPDGEGEVGQGAAFYQENLLRLAQTP